MNETAILDRVGSPAVSTYREFAPPPEWAGVARCGWVQRIGAGAYRQRVLPDGHADVLVDERGRAVLVGPATGVALPVLPAGATVWGLRWRFDGVRPVFGVPASALTDAVVPLDALLDGPRARALADAVGCNDEAAVRAVGRWLGGVRPDARVGAAARLLWHGPALDVAEVAARVGLSARQLRRALHTEVGLGPKTFQRIGRLQRFLALAEAGPGQGLAVLAAEAGYADQPHLSRETRALAGLTAVELLAHRLGPDTAGPDTAGPDTAGIDTAAG
ncbi:MAG TPA: helix-turn-helix domain-containing protein [Pseudonocardia sp.]|nr:helix-turn-helix domain-containing protein [Pseudonocardia sp.]